jgi:YggT family protein
LKCLAASTGFGILCLLLTVYWFVLFARIIASWFPPPRSGPMVGVMRLLYDVTDPVLRPLRSVIPPIRAGMMAIDISPILVFVGIGVIQRLIGCI